MSSQRRRATTITDVATRAGVSVATTSKGPAVDAYLLWEWRIACPAA
ncbi:LacI family DNA-binding transcriptional regulator [Streptomyces bluensis]